MTTIYSEYADAELGKQLTSVVGNAIRDFSAYSDCRRDSMVVRIHEMAYTHMKEYAGCKSCQLNSFYGVTDIESCVWINPELLFMRNDKAFRLLGLTNNEIIQQWRD